jgi:hypothetical protein
LLGAINEIALNHYFHHSEDTRKCPIKECSGVGFVEISPLTGMIECEEPFQCGICEKKWLDPLQKNTSGYWLIDLKYRTQRYFEKVAQNILKVQISAPCPNCSILIQKNGGCSHVLCQKCNFEFCWHCYGSFKEYDHEDGLFL